MSLAPSGNAGEKNLSTVSQYRVDKAIAETGATMNKLRKRSYHHACFGRSTAAIPSAPIAPFNPEAEGRVTHQTYTGSLVKGIATMHKSNLIPVTEGIGTNPKIT
jgi:hypothetical protein